MAGFINKIPLPPPSGRWSWLLLAALVIILAFASIRAYVRIMEPYYLFHPQTGLEITPALAGMEYHDVYLDSGGNRIHGWYLPKKEAHGFIIYYHGNAGNMAHTMDFLKYLEPLKAHVLAIDYRGYGKSGGSPTIEGVEADALAALDWLVIKQKADVERVVLWGFSMGASAAVSVAEKRPDVAGVILEGAFLSMRRMSMDILPWLPVAFVTDGFNSMDRMPSIRAPKLFIHGLSDPVAPFGHGVELYERAGEPKRFIPVKGAGHGDVYIAGGKRLFTEIEGWVYSRFAEGEKKLAERKNRTRW